MTRQQHDPPACGERIVGSDREISFLPVVVGLVIAALASIWHIGVDMRHELDATI